MPDQPYPYDMKAIGEQRRRDNNIATQQGAHEFLDELSVPREVVDGGGGHFPVPRMRILRLYERIEMVAERFPHGAYRASGIWLSIYPTGTAVSLKPGYEHQLSLPDLQAHARNLARD